MELYSVSQHVKHFQANRILQEASKSLQLALLMWSILWVQEGGLNCTAACLECNSDSCTNPSPTIYINEIDDDGNNEQK
ncbi:hypothetical protein TNIN_17111 [Trichonephila inaurata madagascariensis]|uniref:Uncharacterized protein n=1 Tax=Trichonephila inaurata madagascariensis TaxID=2747483 RepID=A0A8X7C680_9ARAC|nr:hypothetical protein TNIN_17111 [Trichonephila inaurata madagascariensis]